MKFNFNSVLRQKKFETLRRQHRPIPDDLNVSYSTEKRFKMAHSIAERKPRHITEARLAAKGDIRVAYKQACALVAFAGDKPAAYKFNADATTFNIQAAGTGDTALIWNEVAAHDELDPDEPGESDGEVVSDQAASGLGIFIKWMHLCSAIGESGPLVLIVAIPKMPENVFFVQKVTWFVAIQSIQLLWHFNCGSHYTMLLNLQKHFIHFHCLHLPRTLNR